MSDAGEAIFQYGGTVGEDFYIPFRLSGTIRFACRSVKQGEAFHSGEEHKKGSPLRAPGRTRLAGGAGFGGEEKGLAGGIWRYSGFF